MGVPAKVTAQSLYVVYKQLPEEAQAEFRQLLSHGEVVETLDNEWLYITEKSLEDVWGGPENDIWDKLYTEQQGKA